MHYTEIHHYLKYGVKRFCILPDSDYTWKLLRKELETAGFTLIILDEPAELKSLVTKPMLFKKAFYICGYDGAVWTWSEKLTNQQTPFCMLAKTKTCKSAEELLGPPEAEVLGLFRRQLHEQGCIFREDGWKALIDAYRSKDTGKIDFDTFYNKAYSLGLQVEEVTQKEVQEILGYKAQIWDLFNALIAKNRLNTLRALHLLVDDKEAVSLCNGLQKMFGDLLNVRDILKSTTSDAYAEEKKMHPYRAKMLFASARDFPAARVLPLLDMLNSMELKLKSSSYFRMTEIFKQCVLYYLDQKEI